LQAVVRVPEPLRNSVTGIRRVLLSRRDGARLPLGSIAQIELREGPSQIKRQMAKKRRIVPAIYRYFDRGLSPHELRVETLDGAAYEESGMLRLGRPYMDTLPVLKSIVASFPSLTDDAMESLLVSFDALVSAGDPGQRPAAADVLRGAAQAAGSDDRRKRLMMAAAAVEEGRPCAVTPEVLAARVAAAQQTVHEKNWNEDRDLLPLPAAPADEDDQEDEDDEAEEEVEGVDYLLDPPPALPHLPTRHFFRGLAARVGRDFQDIHGGRFCGTDLLTDISPPRVLPRSGLISINARRKSVNLDASQHEKILENANNEWFQPVPTIECLMGLCDALAGELETAEEALYRRQGDPREYMMSKEDENILGNIRELQAELRASRKWLEAGAEGPAPALKNARAGDLIFEPGHRGTNWVALLYAAIPLVNETGR